MRSHQTTKLLNISLVMFAACWLQFGVCLGGWLPEDEVTLPDGYSEDCSSGPKEQHMTYERLFGDNELPEVPIANTCDPVTVVLGGSYSDCGDGVKISVPEFLNSTPTVNWGMQGPYVVVCGCDGKPFPAQGRIDEGITLKILHRKDEVSDTCGSSPFIYSVGTVSDTYYYAAYFDTNVFEVNGKRESPQLVGTQINVTLVNPGYETLKQSLNATVEIYYQKLQSSEVDKDCEQSQCSNDGADAIHAIKQELSPRKLLTEIGIKLVPSDVLDGLSSLQNSSSSQFSGGGSGGGGCSGGGCGGSQIAGSTIGNASVDLNKSQNVTLGAYGSLGFWGETMPELNAGGGWLRAKHYPWSTQNFSFDVEGNPNGTITKVSGSFSVLAWDRDTYHYEYEETGEWVYDPNVSEKMADQLAWESMQGKIPLKEITRRIDGIDTVICDFSYYPSGLLESQRSFDENGDPDGYIYYAYEDNAEPGSPLTRVWAGTNPSDFAPSTTPTGGRWIDVEYVPTGDQGQGQLRSVDFACSECRSNRIYEMGGPSGNQVTAIKTIVLNDQLQPVEVYLERFDYDSRGRFTSHSLGDNDLQVTTWERTDYTPEDATGSNLLIRRDFVNNTQYRAKVFMADKNGALQNEIHYHDLQDYDFQAETNWLTGPFSIYTYGREGDVYITTYPKGNKLCKHYDTNGNVIKIQWDDAQVPNVQYEYDDYFYNGLDNDPNMRISLLMKEINAYGGETIYTYEGTKVKTRTEPLPQYGISDSNQQIMEYNYDAQGRLDWERRKNSTGQYVYTKYVYDFTGKLKRTHENCADFASPNPTTGLITTYEYNEYNENDRTIKPGNQVHRKFYSASGTVIADATYLNEPSEAISATIYVYEDGRLAEKKQAIMDAPFAFTEAHAQNGGIDINWVRERYEYDDYGRRIEIIADAGGENLTTRYEYNNQGEIILVLKPDQRYQKTIRDGRGLVSMEITGVKVGNDYHDKAVTRFYYDLNGNLVKKIDPEGVTEIYQYDSRDRMIRSRRGR